jgi:hypothetical protein
LAAVEVQREAFEECCIARDEDVLHA